MDRYHHGNLKAALLKAAFHLVAKAGVEGFTLREVARRAGVSHNAPYRHFKSKDDLVAALATEGFRQLQAALVKALEPVSGPRERLDAAAQLYLYFALQNPARFQVMFHTPIDWNAYPDYQAAYSELLALLGDLMRAHGCKAVDAETAGDLIWSAIHGITELGIARRLWAGDVTHLERLVTAAVDVLLRGVAAPVGAR